ncbi:MAG: hypothetical protein ACETWR_21350 [Anaerolineae bacterium]
MGENIAPFRIPPGWIRLGIVVTGLLIGTIALLPTGETPPAPVLDTPTPTPRRPTATTPTFTRTPTDPTSTPTFTRTPTRPRPTATATAKPSQEWIRLTNSTEDFSDVQGTNNWYYMASNGRNSGNFQEIPWDPKDDWWEWCYDPALGKAPCPETYVGWRNDFGHPGMYADVARVWVSPVSGPLKIVGGARKEQGGGDGVLVEVYHWHSSGHDKLWATTIGANDTSPKYFDLRIGAGKGDRLFFVLKIRGQPEWDKTFLDVTIYMLKG